MGGLSLIVTSGNILLRQGRKLSEFYTTQNVERLYFIHRYSDKSLKGTVVSQACHSRTGSSLEITSVYCIVLFMQIITTIQKLLTALH